MNFLLIYKMALHSIWENKTRSFLTMLGVIIGVAAVIVAVAFAEGSMETITNRVENMGANSITAMITSTSASRTLTLDKLKKFERDCVYIESISPYITLNSDVKYKSESKTTRIFGTDERYLEIDGMNIERGRFITALDIEKNEKVAVIGSAVDKKLFGGIDAIGEYIKINGSKFLVVGIIESVANGIEGTNDDMVCIPITVAQRTLKITNVTMFLANATSTDTVNLANQKIEEFLYSIFKDEDAYISFTSESILSILGDISGVMMLVLGSIATISLVVGGIGIMNIMLVSVSERTREIGIRKAIGAKKKDILKQFLVEALMITGIGGIIGIVFALLIIKFVIGSLDLIEPTYSVPWIVSAFSISLAIGVIFGIIPANKAANLNPIDALHNE